jgi:hypothetical protein
MKLSALIAPLIAAKAPHDQIMAVIVAFEAQQSDALEQRRASDRERQSRRRHVTSRDVTVTVPSREGVARVEDKTSNLDIEPQQQEERNARKRASIAPGFDEFWTIYPNKVGKPKAHAEFIKALRRASFETIIAGLNRYVAKTDDRAWCNPATWLHQDRWADEPAAVRPLPRGSPAQAVPELSELFAMAGERFSDERSAENFTGTRQALPNLSLVRSGRNGG